VLVLELGFLVGENMSLFNAIGFIELTRRNIALGKARRLLFATMILSVCMAQFAFATVTITGQPTGGNTVAGGTVTMSVTATGTSETYQWRKGGEVTTIVGQDSVANFTDGNGVAALAHGPRGVALDGAGNLYIADTDNHTIRKMTPAGDVTTIAGSATNNGNANGNGSAARFSGPRAVTLDASGNVYVADTLNRYDS